MGRCWLIALVALAGCHPAGPPPVVGTLERDRLELVAEVQERIVALPVREGAVVAADEVLVRLDDSRVQAQLAQARAERDQAAQRLAEVLRGPRPTEISEARAALTGAQERLAVARQQRQRVAAMVAQKFMSERELDSADAEQAAALAARDEAQARLRQLEEGATREERAQAQSAAAASEAKVRQLELTLDKLTVRAPGAGILDVLPYHLGERPPAGAVVAIVLAAQAPYARVYVPAALRPGVRQGTPARVRVEGYADAFGGRVRWISADAAFTPYYALTERQRGRLAYLAEVELSGQPARALPTGLPVEVDFPAADAPP
jgi:HlyD family secretion protein